MLPRSPRGSPQISQLVRASLRSLGPNERRGRRPGRTGRTGHSSLSQASVETAHVLEGKWSHCEQRGSCLRAAETRILVVPILLSCGFISSMSCFRYFIAPSPSLSHFPPSLFFVLFCFVFNSLPQHYSGSPG